jgi:hypothetical protein
MKALLRNDANCRECTLLNSGSEEIFSCTDPQPGSRHCALLISSSVSALWEVLLPCHRQKLCPGAGSVNGAAVLISWRATKLSSSTTIAKSSPRFRPALRTVVWTSAAAALNKPGSDADP